MATLRKPLFLVALILIAIVVSIELGSHWLMSATHQSDAYATPGLGIRYLALLDGIVLFNVAYMGLAFIMPERVTGGAQGVVTLILSICLVIGGVLLAIVAFELLMLMVTLLMAAPFGTIAYFALFAYFPPGAGATLGTIMFLTLCSAGCLVLANTGFLKAKALLFAMLTAILATFVVRLLLVMVPGFLDRITDSIGALIVAILAVLWGIYMLVGSILAIIKLVQAPR